ncbi:AAA family ATPase [Streptomyces chitinivorans]|uniref:AAA family ATPase n=1 Tax=Streptomyces chitinivorans TaxID=1257027 RepID=A0ABW7HTH0_9ACTN|nr:AAA family ATPase [Streptomyces chitinivorans]MDH2412220.1 AAA family ATPase [Streptomyces chitinivorans]
MTAPAPASAPARTAALAVPDLSLVVLVGTTGAGKSTFARTHFAPTQVVSSDFCRGLVADDENDQSASSDAFDVLHYITGKRLAAGRLTVVDATNVRTEARRQLVRLAREHGVLPVAIVLDVPAERVWYEPVRPLTADAPGGHEGRPLALADVHGRRVVETRHAGRVAVREENAAAALEVMSRFAIDPRLLPYLPPTMAPCATSRLEGYLEHPAEAFAEYRAAGVAKVVCEEKHMGSRAVTLVCRDADTAAERFGATGGETGALHTRTGRPFFDDRAVTEEVLARVRAAADGAGLWEELDTDWLLLDAELLPWSLKSAGLLRRQYAAVGAAAEAAFPGALAALEAAAARGSQVDGLLARQRERAADAAAFTEAYGRCCRPVDGLDGVELAPFQILAVRGRSLAAVPHVDQLAWLDRLAGADGTGLLRRTGRLVVDTGDEVSVAAGTDWWLELTEAGGEGMVVKPLDALVRGPDGRPVQPGVKCRGREYLRIVYGPEYAREENLRRLRERHLGHKRSLALREYALGLEALDRLARGEPLWRVHEAVFAVLALESEPVDPRL